MNTLGIRSWHLNPMREIHCNLDDYYVNLMCVIDVSFD